MSNKKVEKQVENAIKNITNDRAVTTSLLNDLMEYLHRNNFKDYPRNKLTAKLKQLSGEPHFFNIKGKGVNVWFIEEFQAQEEPHDLPDFDDSLI